ncbi:MAG: iron donor protein CyaY [Sulfuricellaceae bacterium]|jgi:CyaY protein
MTESEYHQLADDTLKKIEATLDDTDADVDYDRVSGGVLEIRFRDGSVIVINKQTPMRELWIAAKAGGYHYAWKDGAWHNTREGGEFLADLSRFASAQAGETIDF